MKLLVVFITLNIVNVVLQTVKSLCTVKCGKTIAAVVNAIAYALYTVVIIYTVCDLSTFTKALVVGLCNLVGVYVVKAIEEKTRKDKLWLVKVTLPTTTLDDFLYELDDYKIPFTSLRISGDKYRVVDTYCNTQKDTEVVTNLAKKYNGKCFATENKLW